MRKKYFIQFLFATFLVGCTTPPQSISYANNDPDQTQNAPSKNATTLSIITIGEHDNYTTLKFGFTGNLPKDECGTYINECGTKISNIKFKRIKFAIQELAKNGNPHCKFEELKEHGGTVVCKSKRGNFKILLTESSINITLPDNVYVLEMGQGKENQGYRIYFNLKDTPSTTNSSKICEKPNIICLPQKDTFKYRSEPKKTDYPPIIDSELNKEEIIAAAMKHGTPEYILKRLELVKVSYYSFDGKIHEGQLVVDRELVKDIDKIFARAREKKFPIQSVIPVSADKFYWDDNKSMNENNTSAFNYRKIAGGKKLSQHAYGRAIDINPKLNPYKKGAIKKPYNAEYDITKDGTLSKNTQYKGSEIVKAFKSRGWTWGGDWKYSKDYQHFEKK